MVRFNPFLLTIGLAILLSLAAAEWRAVRSGGSREGKAASKHRRRALSGALAMTLGFGASVAAVELDLPLLVVLTLISMTMLGGIAMLCSVFMYYFRREDL